MKCKLCKIEFTCNNGCDNNNDLCLCDYCAMETAYITYKDDITKVVEYLIGMRACGTMFSRMSKKEIEQLVLLYRM